MQDGIIRSMGAARALRVGVSATVLAGFLVQPTLAASKDPVLDACQAERAPLVEQDKSYKELKRSKLGAAVGEGIKKGATVIAAGVLSGGIPIGGRGGGGGFGFGFNPVGGIANMAAGAAAQRQAAAAGAPVQATPVAYFGPDIISGAGGLNVPGLGGYSAGGDGKAYAALAVLVAIVGTIDAYARLKEQEAGGDLGKAAYNIDQDAARQLTVSRELATNASALADCRTKQLADINSRLASASNDKDRKAITRERTQYVGALEKDIDLTGGLVNEHTGMAKTFTQGRAMAGGVSEAEVLGPQAPAYAPSASSDKLAMPKGSGGQVQQANYAPGAAPAAAPAAGTAMVTLRATVVRQAPVASSDQVMSLPAGRNITPKTAQPEGGWYEIDVAGQPGYVRASDLGPPGSTAAAPAQTAAAGKGKGGKAPPAARPAEPAATPQLASASNIRAYNGSVIAARDNGKGRLSSLMTDIKTSQRQTPTLLAALIARWFG
jgi:hypothetical protein